MSATRTHPKTRVRAVGPARSRRTPRRRPGVSLIEVLAAVAGVVVVLGMFAATWRLLGRVQTRTDEGLRVVRGVERLAHRFRLDAHDAAAGQWYETEPGDDDPGAEVRSGLRFSRSDGRVVDFRQADGGVRREVRDGERVVHREFFRLPDSVGADFVAWSGEGSRRLQAAMLFVRRPGRGPHAAAGETPRDWFRVVTLVGGAGDEELDREESERKQSEREASDGVRPGGTP